MRTLLLGVLLPSAVGLATVASVAMRNCGQCAADAVVSMNTVPAGVLTTSVDYGHSQSGNCRPPSCEMTSQCNNTAVFTMTLAAGYYLSGGGYACDGGGDYEWSDPVSQCGALHSAYFTVHNGNPCTDQNRVGTFKLNILCAVCSY